MTDTNPMTIATFVTRVVQDGIAAAIADYGAGTANALGSEAGFTDCLGKDGVEIAALVLAARRLRHDAQIASYADEITIDEYWFFACYCAEVEWVANCVSAVLVNEGYAPIVPPTARGVMKAAEIVGVSA